MCHTFPALTSDRSSRICSLLYKHGSSMASNSSGSDSSDRQRIAQQRLSVIAGHLQKPVEGNSGILAAECKAQGDKLDVSSERRTVPRRRYEAVMERWTRGAYPLWFWLLLKSNLSALPAKHETFGWRAAVGWLLSPH